MSNVYITLLSIFMFTLTTQQPGQPYDHWLVSSVTVIDSLSDDTWDR